MFEEYDSPAEIPFDYIENFDEGTASEITVIKKTGQYKVTLKDVDADKVLPTVYYFPAHQKDEAVAKAYKLANVENPKK